LLAARKLGIEHVPVIELAGMSAAEKRAYIIADNKMALIAGWDAELLGLELTDLGALGFDLSLTGFSEDDIASLTSLGTIGLTDPDDVPETPGRATSRRGDVWLLGRHRLICGDSTDPADVERVLDGVRPHLCACDPPYGVNYDPAWRWKLGEAKELATGVRLCEAVSCPLWPFRAGRHPYTRTRLQEADPAACCDGGTDGAGSPSPSRTALQEASFGESGPSPVVRQD
jgi:hypothetical protein